MEVSSLRIFGIIFAGVAIIGLAIVWVNAIDANAPNSTEGVIVTGKNVARVPQGGTIVITYSTTKAYETWKLTFKDDQVVTTCSGLCADPKPATLCGINCEVAIDAGVVSKFKVRLREDGAVSVTWPSSVSWDYRPFRP